MKTTVGVLAVLLLVSTLAIGQQYQPLPFPQEANTALANNPDESSPSMSADMPSSMAANQEMIPTYSDRHDNAAAGSPFPSEANPSLGRGNEDQSTPSWEHQRDLGSPFPGEANPSRE